MNLLLLFVNTVIVLALVALGRSPKYGFLRHSIVNPMYILALLIGLLTLNFFLLSTFLGTEVTGVEEALSYDSIMDANVLMSCYSTALLFAVMFSHLTAQSLIRRKPKRAPVTPRRHPLPPSAAITAVVAICLSMCGLVGMAMIARTGFAFRDMISMRQLFFEDYTWIFVVLSTITPALAIYFSSRPGQNFFSFMLLGIAGAFSLFSGSRNQMLLIGLIFLVALIYDGYKFPSYLILPAIPCIAAFALVTRYVFRERSRFANLGDFVNAKGGLLRVYFDTAEISGAQALTIICDTKSLERYPFESFVGALMFPLPRKIFAFKPLSSSSYFTESVSPTKWNNKSEILTTGFGDYQLMFGTLFGLMMIFCTTCIWVLAVMHMIRQPREKAVLWLPYLIYWMYIFIRGDVFALGQSFWALAIMLVVRKCATVFDPPKSTYFDIADQQPVAA